MAAGHGVQEDEDGSPSSAGFPPPPAWSLACLCGRRVQRYWRRNHPEGWRHNGLAVGRWSASKASQGLQLVGVAAGANAAATANAGSYRRHGTDILALWLGDGRNLWL